MFKKIILLASCLSLFLIYTEIHAFGGGDQESVTRPSEQANLHSAHEPNPERHHAEDPIVAKGPIEFLKLPKFDILAQDQFQRLVAQANNSDLEAQKMIMLRACWHVLPTDWEKNIQIKHWQRLDSIAKDDLSIFFILYFYSSEYVLSQYQYVIDVVIQRANAWIPAAQCNLGRMYECGLGVDQNDEIAALWYKKAAERGIVRAQFKLGRMYSSGLGVDQNDEIAVQWYTRAAEQGYVLAQCNLGRMYECGLGVDQNYEIAAQWCTKAAEQGHPAAQFILGIIYQDGLGVDQNYVTAFKWFIKAAEQGYALAQCELGLMYLFGRGVDQNYVIAAHWCAKAAEQGYALAQCELGLMYLFGRGVDQNYEIAAHWCTKAAEQMNVLAQYNLGIMYKKGQGVEQNDVTAFKWFIKAAEEEFAEAQNMLKEYFQVSKDAPCHENVTGMLLEELEQDVQALIARHDLRRMLNNSEGGFQEHAYAVPKFHELFTELTTLDSELLKLIAALKTIEPGFMISCLAPTDKLKQVLKKCSDFIRYYADAEILIFEAHNI